MGFFSMFKKREIAPSTQRLESNKGSQTHFISEERKNELNKRLSSGGIEELTILKKKIMENNKSAHEITIKNIEQLDLLLSSKPSLREVIKILHEGYPDFLSGKFDSKIFPNNDELVSYVKMQIMIFLNQMHLDLVLRISKLRKTGKKVSYTNLKVMYISSKLKLFKEDMNAKDLGTLLTNFRFCEEKIKKLECQ